MTSSSQVATQGALAEALQALVALLPPHFSDDSREVAAALRDRCPNAPPRELAVLVDAAAHGVPARLRTAGGSAISAAIVARRWAEASTVDAALALWAVRVWAQALGIAMLPERHDTAAGDVTLSAEPAQRSTERTEAKTPRRRRRVRFWILLACGLFVTGTVALVCYGLYLDRDGADASTAGDRASRAGQWSLAQTAYARAAGDDDRNEHAWYGDGFALCKLGQYDDGLAALARAAILRPQSVDPVLAYGGCQLAEGNVRGAFAYLDHATAAFPRSAALWNDRGMALARLDRRADAAASFQRALTIDPDDTAARRNLANLDGGPTAP